MEQIRDSYATLAAWNGLIEQRRGERTGRLRPSCSTPSRRIAPIGSSALSTVRPVTPVRMTCPSSQSWPAIWSGMAARLESSLSVSLPPNKRLVPMSQIYSDPSRATNPHALPNVETFHIDATRLGFEPKSECGYSVYPACDQPFYPMECEEDICPECAEPLLSPGWYWQACFPGCLPDSAPVGPFATEADAIADAQKQE